MTVDKYICNGCGITVRRKGILFDEVIKNKKLCRVCLYGGKRTSTCNACGKEFLKIKNYANYCSKQCKSTSRVKKI